MNRRGVGLGLALVLILGAVAVTAEARPGRRKARRGKITTVAPLTKDGLPNVQSAAAVVVDMASGRELYRKNPGQVRSIASTGKIFVAMVARQRGLDLAATTEITSVDRDHARGGARTRLPVGARFANRDLLHAMLVASDNRAPTALGRAVGLSPAALVAAMNRMAKELGLRDTRFTDPSGLRGNVSTPRDMARALHAAMQDPILAEIMATEQVTVRSVGRRPVAVTYSNTNLALRRKRYQVLGGKTGYNDPARYCLIVAARIAGRDLYMAFLGAEGELTRFADFHRVANWVSAGASTAAAPH